MNQWFFRSFPRTWARWWSARLAATSICADRWLHVNNPDFTRPQQVMRFALGLLLFLKPGELPLKIDVRHVPTNEK